MRRIKILLIAAFIVTFCLWGGIQIENRMSGRTELPVVRCPEEILEFSVLQDEAVLLYGVRAEDPQDGDLTDQVMVSGISKLISEDMAKVSYIVFDSDNNMATCERMIHYLDYQRPRIYLDSMLSYSSVTSSNLTKGLRAVDSLDGDITDLIRVSTLNTTEESDVYRVVAQVTNSMGDTRRLELPVVIQSDDEDLAVIRLKQYILYLDQGDHFNPRDHIRNVTAIRQTCYVDNVEIDSNVNVNEPGNYWVRYTYVLNGKISKTIMTVVVQ